MTTPSESGPPVVIPEGKRWCYWIPPVGYNDENGYIPSVVVEDEAGHHSLAGNGRLAAPWYWGKTFDEANETAAKANAARGITPDDAIEIVMSMMRQQLR